jgi:predicted permease
MLRRGRIDRELEEELAFHLEMKARDEVARGMSEKEARWAARRAFGNAVLAREDSRGAWRFHLVETTLQDVRFGLRTLLRAPVFTGSIVLTLALGIGANTAIFTLLDRVMLRSLPVERPGQLYVLGSRYSMTTIQSDGPPQRDGNFFSHPLYLGLRRNTRCFARLAAFSSWPVTAHLSPDPRDRGAEADRAMTRLVSGSFFETLGVQAELGRVLGPEDDRTAGAHPVAVVSHAFWTRRLGQDPDVLGRPLRLNGTTYSVVGVARRGFHGVTVGLNTDVWVPLAMQAALTRDASYLEDSNVLWLRVIGRLREGLSPESATAETNGLFRRLVTEEVGGDATPETDRAIAKLSTELAPFARGFSGTRQQYSQALLVLMAVAGLVLLTACANVGNLLLARAASRGREVSVRLALGAGRARLVRQLLTESLLLAMAGGALALLVARVCVASILGLIYGAEPQLDVGLDGRVLGFTFVVSAATALVFGLAPSRRGARVDLVAALKTQRVSQGASRRGSSLRSTLVVSQVAASLVLLVGAGLFLRSLDNLRSQDLGFRPQGMLQLEIDPQGGGLERQRLPGLYRTLVERLEGLPVVDSASLSAYNLLSGSRIRNQVTVDGYLPPSQEDTRIEQTAVTPDYFRTLGISPLQGRGFEASDREGAPRVAVVNQSFARHFFGDASPIGRRFGVDREASSRDIEIVGLVADVKCNGLWEAPPRLVYFPVAQQPLYLQSLEVRSRADLAGVIGQVRGVLSDVAPELPVLGAWTLEREIDRSLRQEKLLSRLSSLFAVLALLLAAVGLYGVLAYGVSQRTSEIGIRMALGAPRLRVLWMVLRSAAGWVGLGMAIGLALTLAAGRALSSLLFDLAPADPLSILSAAAALALVAAFAAFWPARRAARLDPVQAIRYE